MDLNRIQDKNVLSRLAINNSGFVFDPMTGQSFFLNETGIMILDKVINENELPQIKAMLMDKYDVSQHELEQDIRDFFCELNKIFIKQ